MYSKSLTWVTKVERNVVKTQLKELIERLQVAGISVSGFELLED